MTILYLIAEIFGKMEYMNQRLFWHTIITVQRKHDIIIINTSYTKLI